MTLQAVPGNEEYTICSLYNHNDTKYDTMNTKKSLNHCKGCFSGREDSTQTKTKFFIILKPVGIISFIGHVAPTMKSVSSNCTVMYCAGKLAGGGRSEPVT